MSQEKYISMWLFDDYRQVTVTVPTLSQRSNVLVTPAQRCSMTGMIWVIISPTSTLPPHGGRICNIRVRLVAKRSKHTTTLRHIGRINTKLVPQVNILSPVIEKVDIMMSFFADSNITNGSYY